MRAHEFTKRVTEPQPSRAKNTSPRPSGPGRLRDGFAARTGAKMRLI